MSDHLSLIILDKQYTTERLKLWTGNTSTHTSQSGSSRRQNMSKFWRMRIRNTEKRGKIKTQSPSIRYYSQGSVTSDSPGTETGKDNVAFGRAKDRVVH